MTKVYFVRHAEPDYANHDDRNRPLSPKGRADARLVTDFFAQKQIDIVCSSPFVRAVDTVRETAAMHGLPIELAEDFRERKVDSGWIEDFDAFCMRQWEDFDYKLSDGESLREVQSRNLRALHSVLERHAGANIVIGSHGTALSTIIHRFEPSFGYGGFRSIQKIMPWIVRFDFDGEVCTHICSYDLFSPQRAPKEIYPR